MQLIFKILIIIFFTSNAISEDNEKFLMLKNDKVNVRYGPSFDYPIKYIYKKINLPVKVIDKKENFIRIICSNNNYSQKKSENNNYSQGYLLKIIFSYLISKYANRKL